ncbi:hypothetical protein QQG55_21525 [Brugia pahangi]
MMLRENFDSIEEFTSDISPTTTIWKDNGNGKKLLHNKEIGMFNDNCNKGMNMEGILKPVENILFEFFQHRYVSSGKHKKNNTHKRHLRMIETVI